WSRSFPATGAAQAWRIATDPSSDIVVIGSASGSIDFGGGPIPATGVPDLFVVKLHADSSYLWGKGFGNTGGTGLALNDAGGVFIDGMLTGPAALGGGTLGGPGAIFVASLDAMGGYRWAKSFGPQTVASIGGALAVDSSSRLFVSAGIGGTSDFGC